MVNIKMEELRFPRRRGALKPTKIQVRDAKVQILGTDSLGFLSGKVVHGQNSHFTGKNLGRKAWMRGRSVIPQAGRYPMPGIFSRLLRKQVFGGLFFFFLIKAI